MKRSYIEGEWINALMRAFSNLGLDTDTIIKDLVGFENQRFISGHRLDVGSARKMWHRADKLANDPLLGLKAGSSLDYRAVGVLAPVIWHSPTVRVALNNIGAFQTLVSESGAYHGSEITVADQAYLNWEYLASYNVVPVNPHQILAVVTGTLGIVAAISNQQVQAKRLMVPATLNPTLIAQALKQQGLCTEVQVTTGNLALHFDLKTLDLPIPGCDEHLYQLNKGYAEELLRNKRAGLALIDMVKDWVIEQNLSQATIEGAFDKLGMQPRTLQRNLTAQGTSFRQIKEEVLKEFAVKWLLREKRSVNEVALRLGYSESSAFHRAFKTWFGVTPIQFCSGHHY